MRFTKKYYSKNGKFPKGLGGSAPVDLAQGWRAFFDKDQNFRTLIRILRYIAVAGIVISFSVHCNDYNSHIPFFPEASATARKLAFAIVTILFICFITATDKFYRKTCLFQKEKVANRLSLRPSNSARGIWISIIGDCAFYVIFYCLSGNVESGLFSLLLLPVISAAILLDLASLAKALTTAIVSLSLILFIFYLDLQLLSTNRDIQHESHWIYLFVFSSRAFSLFSASIPVAWLCQRHVKLTDARLRYVSLVDHIPQMIIRKNLLGQFTFANKSFCKLNNLKQIEILGKSDEFMYGKDAATRYKVDDDWVIENRRIRSFSEKHTPHGKNKELYVRGFKIPIFDSNGAVTEIQIIFWDISIRKKWEIQIGTLMDTTSDFIYFKDLNGGFMRISRSLVKKFGIQSSDDAQGKTDRDFLGNQADDTEVDERLIQETGSSIEDKEEKRIWPDGGTSYVSTTKQCIKDESNKIIGLFGISRDITSRKEHQQSLEAAKEELRRAKSKLDLQVKSGASIAHFGFFEYRDIDGNTRLVTATEELFRLFESDKNSCTAEQMRDLIDDEYKAIWDTSIKRAYEGLEGEPFEIRIICRTGTVRFLHVKLELDNDPNPEKAIYGIAQDVTELKREMMRAEGLELVVKGFQHMIPGKADEAIGALDSQESVFSNEIVSFLFMIRHKTDEINSLNRNKAMFQYYDLGEIICNSWVVATDLRLLNCKDLFVWYGGGASKSMKVNGAMYTAVLNVLSNARRHGKPPFAVFCLLSNEDLKVVVADGGPKPKASRQDPSRSGVGLKLVKRILELVNGRIEKLDREDLPIPLKGEVAATTNYVTFYCISITNDNTTI